MHLAQVPVSQGLVMWIAQPASILVCDISLQSWSLVGVVILIASGLFMFTYQSTQFVLEGFLLVLGASFLSGLRWTTAQLVLQKAEMGELKQIYTIDYEKSRMSILTLTYSTYFLPLLKVLDELSILSNLIGTYQFVSRAFKSYWYDVPYTALDASNITATCCWIRR